MRNKILSLLVLLLTAATGAWADELATSYTTSPGTALNNVTVSADMEINIAAGVTVTINDGLTIASGKTLTIYGPGTLVVTGKDGDNGTSPGYGSGANGGDGNNGGAAISGNIIIKGGANVQATGGNGGQGGDGGKGANGGNGGNGANGGNGGNGGKGAQGGAAFTGAVTIYSGSINAVAGQGGQGGDGGDGGDGVNALEIHDYIFDGPGGKGGDGGDGGSGGLGGYAFAGTLTFFGGSVTAKGGDGGDGGTYGIGGVGGLGAPPGSNGSESNIEGQPGGDGKAYASNPDIQPTDYTMTDGTNEITEATGIKIVNLSAANVLDPNDPKDILPVIVTTNAATGETYFTEASFDMPDYDATAEYELVRDMTYEVTATLSSSRIRITKDASEKFVTAVDDALALTVSDVISGSPVDMSAYDATTNVDGDYTATLQKKDGNDWKDVTDLSVGTFRYLVTGVNNYDGTTTTATFELFQGYEVTVPAGEYITYYKDEAITLDAADKESIELLTITSVSDDKATLSSAIDAMPKNKPMLVHNKSTEDKTFYLIPCAEPNVSLTIAPEFKGTLTGTNIAASTGSVSNYALNGKQFVIVRTGLQIGANKCWLSITHETGGTSGSHARAITFVFDDATGIRSMDNGQWTMDNWYDLNGRKLSAAPKRKGVYIKNGQKVVIK